MLAALQSSRDGPGSDTKDVLVLEREISREMSQKTSDIGVSKGPVRYRPVRSEGRRRIEEYWILCAVERKLNMNGADTLGCQFGKSG